MKRYLATVQHNEVCLENHEASSRQVPIVAQVRSLDRLTVSQMHSSQALDTPSTVRNLCKGLYCLIPF